MQIQELDELFILLYHYIYPHTCVCITVTLCGSYCKRIDEYSLEYLSARQNCAKFVITTSLLNVITTSLLND